MNRPRLLLLQYAGDLLAAHTLLSETGQETYYGHAEIFARLEEIQATQADVVHLSLHAGRAYDHTLPSGLRLVGLAHARGATGRALLTTLGALAPTHLVALYPHGTVLRHARRQGWRTLGLFADSFELHPLRLWRRHGRFRGELQRLDWIANHGLQACASLERQGVPVGRIVPWDWPHRRRPHDLAAKTAPPADPAVFFAGLISANKGVGDLIRAIALLRAQGQAVRAEIAGRGEVEHFRALAAKLGVGDAVRFLGSIPNAEVVARMRAAAVVTVPSHHSYPEGLPLTIYEALSARTPLVVSDHPMFAGNLVDGQSALVYKAGDAAAMAARIGRLLGDPALYAALSAAAPAAWEALQIEAKWGAVIAHWLRGDADWLAAHSLAALRQRDGASTASINAR